MNNNLTEIKNGLTNYLGLAILALSKEDPVKAKHQIVALVMESLLDLSKDENEEISMFATKPILRSTLVILKSRVDQINSIGIYTEELNNAKSKYESTIKVLEDMLNNIK